jgi:hypothetical protein
MSAPDTTNTRVEGAPPASPLTARALLVAFIMVLAWTVACVFAVAAFMIYAHHLLLILGFGAILTIFLLQTPRLFLGTILAVWAGITLLAVHAAAPGDGGLLVAGALRASVVCLPLAALAAWLWRRPLRRGELVIVYAAVAVAIPWAICLKGVLASSAGNLIEVQRFGEPQVYAWVKELPWWGPTVATGPQAPPAPEALAAAEDFCRGNGGEVPWSLWWRPILYWTALSAAWAAMIMGLLLLFRKRWIEHERLPFTWATPALTLIRGKATGAIDPAKPAELGISRRYWALFLAGFAFCLPAILSISPTGQSLAAWPCPPSAGQGGILGGIDLTGLNLLPGVDLRLLWCPVVLAALLLVPLDVLLTVAGTFILVRLLLPGILNSFGFATAQSHLNSFFRHGLQLGGVIGLVFWSFWFNRGTIWGYVRSLWGGAPTTPESADELGRRKIILLAVVGFVVFVALGSCAAHPYWLGGVPVPVQMLIMTLMIVVYTLAQVRMRAEGQLVTYDNNFPSHQMVGLQRDLLHDHFTLAARGVPVSGTSWAIHWFQWGICGQFKSLGPQNALLEAFKIGHETGVHPRAVARVILWTLLLVALLVPVAYLLLVYTYGYTNTMQGMLSTGQEYTQWAERAASYGQHSTSRVFWVPAEHFYDRFNGTINVLYGVALVGILFHLRREYPRFPVSPVGVVIAAQVNGGRAVFSTEVIWFSFLLAGLAKWLLFRWMGVRAFRERIQPGVIFLLCGLIFGILLYVLRHVPLGIGFLK